MPGGATGPGRGGPGSRDGGATSLEWGLWAEGQLGREGGEVCSARPTVQNRWSCARCEDGSPHRWAPESGGAPPLTSMRVG